MYVIKFNNSVYWCGYNTCDPQLRKAKIYTSKKMATDVAEDCLKRQSCIKSLTQPVTYKLVEVIICEKE